ncbi:5-formyltetrahydrofolate cyclo-ligase [Trichogramma pretiosum]|uniref:5-formyltetrahydrofolate cyclo-ligase n=1 Tax=Trichogramma pretiosum TaxID=7493 RepID=UPI0006C9BE79|nr:5-formyltetrahydrofolate cyclo-ligase [Trichogramma pretiosum]
MATLRSAKTRVRKEVREIISRMDSQERRRQSDAVFKKLISLPEYQSSQRISIFLSTPEEVDTVNILEDIFNKNKEVFVPRYNGKTMEMVKLYSMEDYEKLPLTKWNIKQPTIQEIRERAFENGGLDLIILPGVAFTLSGKRIGHGKGYYDKYLESVALHEKRMPYLVAVAFNEQIYQDIPTGNKDVLVDLVLSEKDC